VPDIQAGHSLWIRLWNPNAKKENQAEREQKRFLLQVHRFLFHEGFEEIQSEEENLEMQCYLLREPPFRRLLFHRRRQDEKKQAWLLDEQFALESEVNRFHLVERRQNESAPEGVFLDYPNRLG
jgi:hypothetical protein